MGFKEDIRKQLKSTGLYQLSGDTLVEAEMYAYAAVMEELHSEMQSLLKDCFLNEVESPKGEVFEDLFGLPATKFPLTAEKTEERLHKIEMMKRRLKVKNSDFDKEALKKQIETGGMKVNFTEDFGNKAITVSIFEDKGYIEESAEKIKFIKQILPCHSTVTVNF